MLPPAEIEQNSNNPSKEGQSSPERTRAGCLIRITKDEKGPTNFMISC